MLFRSGSPMVYAANRSPRSTEHGALIGGSGSIPDDATATLNASRNASALLLSGAVLTEQVFSIPGFGKLIVDAVFNRDYAVVQGVVLITATTYITLNLLADLAAFVVNPRLRP